MQHQQIIRVFVQYEVTIGCLMTNRMSAEKASLTCYIMIAAYNHGLQSVSPVCPGEVQMFTKIQNDCTLRYYLALQNTHYNQPELLTMALASNRMGVVSRNKHKVRKKLHKWSVKFVFFKRYNKELQVLRP